MSSGYPPPSLNFRALSSLRAFAAISYLLRTSISLDLARSRQYEGPSKQSALAVVRLLRGCAFNVSITIPFPFISFSAVGGSSVRSIQGESSLFALLLLSTTLFCL